MTVYVKTLCLASVVIAYYGTVLVAQDELPVIVPRQIPKAPAEKTYASVYESIPFNRAEYEANPGYRHDAAMEILFGKLRDTVIYRNGTPRPINNTSRRNDYRYGVNPNRAYLDYSLGTRRGFYTNRYNYYYLPPRRYRNY